MGLLEKSRENPGYLIKQGYFIKVMIVIYYSMFCIILLTILLVAFTVKYQQ